MNNPLELIKSISNPKDFVMNYIKQNSSPILNNLINMANNNDYKGVQQFAQNFLGERGIDLNKLR